jgi:hypothetical protein
MVTRPRDCSWVPRMFTKMLVQHLRCTSDPDDENNCIAWAGDSKDEWWWPKSTAPYKWPDDLPKWPHHPITVTDGIPNFVARFEKLGYKRCRSGRPSRRFEKIALYVNYDGLVKHAARSLPDGTWTSKLGGGEDIEHKTPQCVESVRYGEARVFLKRKWKRSQKTNVIAKFLSFLSRLFGSKQRTS